MKRALVASAVFHGLLGAALLSFELTSGEPSSSTTPIAIEVIDVVAPKPDVPPVDVQGGGASRTVEAAPSEPSKQRGRSKARIQQKEEVLGDVVIDGSDRGTSLGGGVEKDGDGGEGNGTGGHRGNGIGFGDGGQIVVAEQQFAVPGAPEADVPPPSKARPAKLIYPTRERDLGEDKLFVAKVTVDRDGYVVGAQLVKGGNGPRDSEAADLIFRFRYLPALDEAGRAIKTTFEQPFHVNR